MCSSKKIGPGPRPSKTWRGRAVCTVIRVVSWAWTWQQSANITETAKARGLTLIVYPEASHRGSDRRRANLGRRNLLPVFAWNLTQFRVNHSSTWKAAPLSPLDSRPVFVFTRRSSVQYFFFHLMSWPYLPGDFQSRYDSAWVWLPNALYDPAKGHDLYREYINTLAYAEELGFDGVCVNEHHQNAYGLMPSPNVIAGALTQRTKTCKIAVIGNALPLYNPPLRVAEEFAMLDVLSGGRRVAGTRP